MRAAYFGPARRPGARAGRPDPIRGDPRRVRGARRRGLMNAQHPRQFGYFTPPPLPISIMGELLAQVTNQGVDVWHAGPIAAFVEEEVVRWLCDLVGYGPGSFGLLTSGGVMANFMAMALARDVHLGRLRGAGTAAARRAISRASASTPPTRPTSRSPARSTSWASRPRRSSSSRPTTDFRLRGEPVAAADRPRPRRRPDAVRDRRRRGSTNTGSVDAIGELADLAAARGPLVPRRRGVRRRGPALAARRRPRRRTSSAPTRSRSTRTSGSSRPTTSAGCVVRDGRAPRSHVRRPEARVLPRRRDARPRATDDDHGDQLNFYKLGFEGTRRWRALKLWMSLEAPRDGGLRAADRGERRPGRAPRPPLCREPTTSRRCPTVPELSVVCFRHLPGGRDAALALPAAPRRPPGRAPGRARGVGRRLADDHPTPRRDLAARRDRELPHDRGRHRPTCSRRCDAGGRPGLTGRRAQPRASRIGAATSVASRRIPAAPSRASVVSRISAAPARP